MNDHNAATPSGTSARAIWDHLNGRECDGNYPHDSGDFGRCEAYLRVALIPHDRFAAMTEVNAYWRALVPIWAELGRMEPDALNARLREVLGPIEAADPSCTALSTGVSMRMGGKIDFQGIVPPAGVGNDDLAEEEAVLEMYLSALWMV